MTSEWMGRYRPLVAALVKHGNMAVNNLKHRTEIVPGVRLSSTEWQVLESVIEHELQVTNMNRLAEEIGIPQSTFSKTVSYLCGLGLVEKYQTASNKKNVILQPTDLAREVYRRYSLLLQENVFGDFFRELERADDDTLNKLTKAIESLNQKMKDQL